LAGQAPAGEIGKMAQTTNTERPAQEMTWDQRLLRNSGRQKAALKPEYQELKFTLHRKLLDKINLEALATIDNQRVRAEVRQAVISLIDGEPTLLSSLEKQQISEEVLDEVFGLGPLEPLLQDPGISDILVNTHKQVYIERKGLLELTTVRFRDDQHLLRIIDKIVSQVGRRVDESTPMVDARLSDGSRVNAIIPPLAVDGPLLSIRRFGTDKLMPQDLVDKKALTSGMMELLQGAVKAKLNIIIVGGTGAGKTTLLNAISVFIGNKERIVTIEDAAELQLKQPHVARLETRPANLEGTGAVRQRQLLVNSLRMRPDRIVVGEVRGEEALDMLQAMNTGHDGSLTTIHANTPRDAVSRLEVMVSLANANMQLISIRQQIASAVHLFVQTARLSDGSRRVINLTEVGGMEGDVITLQDIFVFEKRGLSPEGKVLGRFAATGIRPKFYEKLLAAGIKLSSEIFDQVMDV
jgi:pilus assembly protein CpaF